MHKLKSNFTQPSSAAPSVSSGAPPDYPVLGDLDIIVPTQLMTRASRHIRTGANHWAWRNTTLSAILLPAGLMRTAT